MRYKKLIITISILLTALALFSYFLSKPDKVSISSKTSKKPEISSKQLLLQGKVLAEKHCTACHALPEPNQLPKEKWPFALRWMGNYLGVEDSYTLQLGIVNKEQMPAKPSISATEFKQLQEYYINSALTQQELIKGRDSNNTVLTQFKPSAFSTRIKSDDFITMLEYDKNKDRVYVGLGTGKLDIYKGNGTLISSTSFTSQPSYVEPFKNGYRVSLLGHLIANGKKGQVIEVTDNGKQKVLIKGYDRLTQSHYIDLDNNKKQDLLTIGYGDHDSGRVSIFWQKDKIFKEQILINGAGSLCAEVLDFNKDGLKDIMILTAQGRNELLLFLNLGNQQFKTISILKQHSGFGYHNFTLADFNKDGNMDIITSNGNNMEFQDPPLKPYHGVRILINNGDLTFSEKYFYPMFGAMKAIAHDFDQDGDLDIAAIAFFPDWTKTSPQTFVYLKNKGNYKFENQTILNEDWVRWMTMDIGDINHDGKTDILLGEGNSTIGLPERVWEKYYWKHEQKTTPSLIILENK